MFESLLVWRLKCAANAEDSYLCTCGFSPKITAHMSLKSWTRERDSDQQAEDTSGQLGKIRLRNRRTDAQRSAEWGWRKQVYQKRGLL